MLRYLFVLGALIYLVKSEGGLWTLAEYCYAAHQTEIESVIKRNEVERNEVGLGLTKPNCIHESVRPSPTSPSCDRYKYALVHYNSFITHQLKTLAHTFIPNNLATLFLQKCNIWHQAPSDCGSRNADCGNLKP